MATHAYRAFIRAEMDARGWKPADLARRSGLSKQTLSKILNDDRPHLGQMPDQSTVEGLAAAFGVPVERVRKAAAQSLVGYVGDQTDSLDDYSTEYLLEVIRRRVATDLPMAARSTDPASGKGRSEQGVADGEESQDGR